MAQQAYRITVHDPARDDAADTGDAPTVEQRPMTREQRRSRRKREVRAKTTSIRRTPKREIELGALIYPKEEHPYPMAGGPKTRADCVGGHRPCPYISCQYHLYLDVNPHTGAIKTTFPDLEWDAIPESCALDVADRGGATLEEVGAYQNVTRERIRQIEVGAMAKVLAHPETVKLRDFVEEGPVGKRRLPVIQSNEDELDDADDDLDSDEQEDTDDAEESEP